MPPVGAAFDLHVVEKHHGRGRTAVPVLADLRLTADVGDCVAIMGPSGAGKTTLLDMLAGLDRAFTGHRRVAATRIGMVFQEPRLLPWRTIGENVALVRPGIGRDAVIAELVRCGLEPELADRHPGALSLGQCRRAALARALIVDPDLLILDEPLASLDEAAARALRTRLAARLAEGATTVVLVSHDLDDALTLADRLVRLDGRPARIAAEIRLDRPRAARDEAWRAAMRARLAGAATPVSGG
jgi:NitT/TauT family transport system ATP-binding protein